MHALVWPAMVYSSTIPGEDFDCTQVQKGLLLRTGMGSNNLDSEESLRGWVWSNDAMTMKSSCEVGS